MPQPKHILVLRFSALGDVAMTVPVIKNILAQNTHIHITFVSVPFHAPLFDGIDRLSFYAVNKSGFKGITGLYRLAKQIKNDINFDAVADLHDVLRTKIIRNFLGNVKIAIIDKGRKEKKELTQLRNKKLRPLVTTFERYANVFEQLGFNIKLNKLTGITTLKPHAALNFKHNDQTTLLGIAPFAKHSAKLYPLKKMEEVVQVLQLKPNVKIFLFGSKEEDDLLRHWTKMGSNIEVIAGKYSFKDELEIIAQMNLMLTMDSANMHLASLYGVPVVSVWGGTHPYLGFYGWGQSIDHAVQTGLPCRPSSVFGNKDCPVHGKAGCMQEISPQMIVDKVEKVLQI